MNTLELKQMAGTNWKTRRSADPALRMGITGGIANIIGILLSGPLGVVIVTLINPTSSWEGARRFVEQYHPVQTFPYFGGFLLVIGYVMMMAAVYQIAEEKEKGTALIAVILTGVFATLIFFNYIIQTTFVPALVADYRPEYDVWISTFSLSSPMGLCWAIEMWGYAVLGLATWLAAPVFRRNRAEKVTSYLMTANGIITILGGFVTSVNLKWVLTTPGLISYVGWNVLVLALAIFFLVSMRKRVENREEGIGN